MSVNPPAASRISSQIGNPDAEIFFIEPHGGETNKTIFREVLGSRIYENDCPGLLCADGVPRDLIRLSLRDIVKCLLNEYTTGLHMTIYRATDDGPIPVAVNLPEEIERARKGEAQAEGVDLRPEHVMQVLTIAPAQKKDRAKKMHLHVRSRPRSRNASS